MSNSTQYKNHVVILTVKIIFIHYFNYSEHLVAKGLSINLFSLLSYVRNFSSMDKINAKQYVIILLDSSHKIIQLFYSLFLFNISTFPFC